MRASSSMFAMLRVFSTSFVVVFLLTSGVVHAQDEFDGGGPEEVETTGAEEDVRYEEKTELDFEDFTLEGEVRKPAQATVTERTALDFGNLIEERKNFEPEMIQSVDQLQ